MPEVLHRVIDFVTAPSIDECVAAGVIPCPYTDGGRPAQAWFDEARAKGVDPLWMIRETVSEASQGGAAQGRRDVVLAEARAREVGHTGAICYVASDGNSADAWDASPWGQAIGATASMPFFFYGALGVVGPAEAGARASGTNLLIPGGWIPATWGQGLVASQLVGPQAPGISTAHDLNDVYYPFRAPPAPVTQEDDDVYVGWGTDPSTSQPWTSVIDGGIPTLPFGGTLSPYGFYQDGWQYAQDNGLKFLLLTPDQIAFANTRNLQVRQPPCGSVTIPPDHIDVDAVVAGVLSDYDQLPNAGERNGLEASLRARLA